jgi:hypothetical protein
MASGHVNRTQRPNTWLHRPMLHVKNKPCQLGAIHTWPLADRPISLSDVRFRGKADIHQQQQFLSAHPSRQFSEDRSSLA